MIEKSQIENAFKSLQEEICSKISATDGKGTFSVDVWNRAEGGGGITRVLTHGNILEKAGVNFSAVWGKTPKKIIDALQLTSADFFATGVSIVMHPFSPRVPIIHMNVRYFEMTDGTYWFGGGIDLTPHYVAEHDAQFFHRRLKNTCDAFDPEYYPKFKTWADEYFFIPHRNETRGIGGIFFDHLNANEVHTKDDLWNFVWAVGQTFVPIYTALMHNNHKIPFGEREKKWQLLRRGRYVEFNLVYDKGTKFGLDTQGRTESILMSMPPMAEWLYNYVPEEGSEEEKTIRLLKKGIPWISYRT